MWYLQRRFLLLEGEGAAGGAPAGGASAAPSASPSPTPTATPSATPAASPSASPAPSALAGGAAQTGTPSDFIPEKYRTNKDDGSLDIEASARKMAEAHTSLEKRLGDGGAPPKSAEEYAVTVPDALKDSLKLDDDQLYKDFRSNMHGLGLTQKQFDGVMSKYFEMVPQLVSGGTQVSAEAATADLRGVWKDESTFKENVKHAYNAGEAVAKAAGLTFADLEKSGLSNNPTFIRLMAAIGPEVGEASSLNESGAGGLMSSETEIHALMQSEANTNTKHPNHAATRARIDSFYARKYGNTPVN